jgi:hypothetical protein
MECCDYSSLRLTKVLFNSIIVSFEIFLSSSNPGRNCDTFVPSLIFAGKDSCKGKVSRVEYLVAPALPSNIRLS